MSVKTSAMSEQYLQNRSLLRWLMREGDDKSLIAKCFGVGFIVGVVAQVLTGPAMFAPVTGAFLGVTGILWVPIAALVLDVAAVSLLALGGFLYNVGKAICRGVSNCLKRKEQTAAQTLDSRDNLQVELRLTKFVTTEDTPNLQRRKSESNLPAVALSPEQQPSLRRVQSASALSFFSQQRQDLDEEREDLNVSDLQKQPGK